MNRPNLDSDKINWIFYANYLEQEQKRLAGKLKWIYIDVGKLIDVNQLITIREMLTEDGTIWVSAEDLLSAEKVMDDVYGKKNKVSKISNESYRFLCYDKNKKILKMRQYGPHAKR